MPVAESFQELEEEFGVLGLYKSDILPYSPSNEG